MKQSCGQCIQVNSGSASVVVEVVDTCMGCASASVDLSPTAFSALAALSVGRIHQISWSFLSSCPPGLAVADQTASQNTLTLSQPLVIGLAVGLSLFVVGIIVAIVVIIKRRKRTEEHV